VDFKPLFFSAWIQTWPRAWIRILDIGHGHGRSPPSSPVNWTLIGALRATLARLINKSLKSGSDLSRTYRRSPNRSSRSNGPHISLWIN